MFTVRVLTLREAYAEKMRAALTRRDPAIRDFFDADNAIQTGVLQHLNPDFLQLVTRKLAITPDPIATSSEKRVALTAQIEAQLKPFLRTTDYESFALERAFAALDEVVSRRQSS